MKTTKPNMITATNDEIRAYYAARINERYAAHETRFSRSNDGLYYFLTVSIIGLILVALI